MIIPFKNFLFDLLLDNRLQIPHPAMLHESKKNFFVILYQLFLQILYLYITKKKILKYLSRFLLLVSRIQNHEKKRNWLTPEVRISKTVTGQFSSDPFLYLFYERLFLKAKKSSLQTSLFYLSNTLRSQIPKIYKKSSSQHIQKEKEKRILNSQQPLVKRNRMSLPQFY